MLNVSLLQGSAGKIFIECLSPRFLIVSLPLVLFYAGVINSTVLINFKHPEIFSAVCLFIGFAGSFSIFAVNGRNGHYDAFWMTSSTHVLSVINIFAVFTTLLTLFCGLWIGLYLLFQQQVDVFLGSAISIFNEYSMKEKMLAVSGLIFLSVSLGIILITFAIIAASCKKYYELFQLSIWANTILKRWGDVMLVNALTIAQIFLITFLYITPIIISFFIIDKLITLSSAHIIFAMIAPVLLSSISLGKLAGAYNYDNEDFLLDTPHQPIKASQRREPEVSAKPIEVDASEKASFTKESVEQQFTKKEPSEIEKAFQQHANMPEDLSTLQNLIKLLSAEGKTEEMLAQTNTAIALAVRQNRVKEASELYQSTGKNKSKLRLESHEFQELAKYFEKSQQYIDAWRCYAYLFSEVDTPEKTVQNKLLELAKHASSNNEVKDAAKLYQFFLKKFPRSDLKIYAENALEMLKIA